MSKASLYVILLLLVIAWFSFPANAQDVAKTYPHPFIEGAFDPGGGGYGVGFDAKTGVDIEEAHFIFTGTAQYEFQRKVNDNDQVANEKGHGRNLGGNTFYKLGSGWFAGAGAQWNETSNTPYTKYSFAPQAGGGKDFFESTYSLRLQVMYLRDIEEFTAYPTAQQFLLPNGRTFASTQCTCNNGVQGVDFNAWYPSPATNSHVFMHFQLDPTFFHGTVTQPYAPNLEPATSERATRSETVFANFGLMYRF
jgi:hypothetical protein